MNVGFDLDGTVLSQDLAILRMQNTADEKEKMIIMKFYCAHRSMNFNPLDFLAENDNLLFITGRDKSVEAITKKWASKYFPNAKIIVTKLDAPTGNTKMINWYLLQAEAKAKVINDNNVEVYFEDAPEIVDYLRKLCPNCKVIKYGGRLNTEQI